MARRRRPTALEEIEEMKGFIIDSLYCACPECGERCDDPCPEYDDDPLLPSRINLHCGKCGDFVVEQKKGSMDWVVVGSDTPYLPEAEDNTLTLYHRFDPSVYDDETEAITAELELLKKLSQMCIDHGAESLYYSLQPNFDRLLERAYENGLKPFYPDYLKVLLYNLSSNSVDKGAKEDIASRIRALLPEISAEELGELMMMTYVLTFTSSDVLDINREVTDMVVSYCDSLKEPTLENLEYLLMVFRVFEMYQDDSHITDIVGKIVRMTDDLSAVEDADVIRAMAYSDVFDYLSKDGDLDRAMDYIEDHGGQCPLEFFNCALSYADAFIDSNDRRERISEMVERILLMADNSEISDVLGPNKSDVLAKAHYFRYCLHNRKGDASKACKNALRALEDSIEGTEFILLDLVDRDALSSSEKRRALIMLEQMGLVGDELDY